MTYILGFILLLVIIVVIHSWTARNGKKLKKLRSEWETGMFRRTQEDIGSIASYWKRKKETTPDYRGVDEITWNDLSMQDVYNQLNYTQTSVGSEFLFDRLHDIEIDPTRALAVEPLYGEFADNAALREKVQLILGKLGKRNYTDSSSFFQADRNGGTTYTALYLLLGSLPVLSLLLLFVSLKAAVTAVFVSFVINLFTYYRNKNRLAVDLHSITYAASVLSTGASLAKLDDVALSSVRQTFRESGSKLRAVSFWGKFLSVGNNTGGDFDAFFEYIRIVFLVDFIAYHQIVKALADNQGAYQQLWMAIGELDSAIAVVYYRRTLGGYTVPSYWAKEELHMDGLAHPLLKHPVRNSGTFGKSVLLTGSNASGKSTFIKAVAVNAILAQTINTVAAKEWRMKPGYILSSMAVQDNVLEGDSYFIAEIKSLRRIIAAGEAGLPMMVFIDEILKGTNTVERIAASASIMEWLATHTEMTMIASHDIELTEMNDLYCNYHFRETIADNEVRFDYQIHEGPSRTRNAIELLNVMEYPSVITVRADRLAEQFTRKREWALITRSSRAETSLPSPEKG